MIKDQRGVTFTEILVILSIFLVLFSVIMYTIDPVALKARGRDNKRISDLAVLERMISEFLISNGSYPDAIDTTRNSTVIPEGSAGPLENSTSGWIKQDLSVYEVKLPLDPINDATYNYKYRHNASGFELNTVLEYYTDKSASDGGNDPNVYEIGNDLTIL